MYKERSYIIFSYVILILYDTFARGRRSLIHLSLPPPGGNVIIILSSFICHPPQIVSFLSTGFPVVGGHLVVVTGLEASSVAALTLVAEFGAIVLVD